VNRHWKAQLQQHRNDEGGYRGVLVARGTTNLTRGDTVLNGNFCYNFQGNSNLIRIEFSLDGESLAGAVDTGASPKAAVEPADEGEDDCSPHLKSASIAPCRHTGACPTSFQDVQEGDPYFAEITLLNSAGIISGYGDGTFQPYNHVTRAQVARIVVLAFGFTPVVADRQRFSDVPAGDPFAGYIETAYAHNLMSGYEDGTFRPGNNVTRGQLAKIVVEAAGLKLASPAAPSFSDIPAGSAFYRYVETAAAHGLMSGYPDGTFRPGEEANRGQACKVIAPAAFPPRD
jgi:hypothetical protein